MIQSRLGQEIFQPRNLPDGLPGLMGFLGDRGRGLVPDLRRKRRAHRQALFNPRLAAFAIRRNAFHTASREILGHLGQELDPGTVIDARVEIALLDRRGFGIDSGLLQSREEAARPLKAGDVVRVTANESDSAMTGLTFPGMMDEPGWVSGNTISPSPQRGPDPIHRMSLAIFSKLTAMVFRMPLVSTSASCAA